MSASVADPLAVPLVELRRRQSVKWRLFPDDVLPMFVAEMDCALAEPLRSALGAALLRSDTGYFHNTDLAGAFADFALRRFGAVLAPANMRAVSDIMTGIEVALQLTTQPGDAVVINPPVYGPFTHVLNYLRRDIAHAPLHDGQLDLDSLDRCFAAGARTWLLCNPHNPHGTVFSRESLTAAASLCDRYGVEIISDEVHGPLTRRGLAFTPIPSVDAESAANAITVTSASKTFNTPGLKAALVHAGNADVAASLLALNPALAGPSLFGALAGVAAFTEGDQWLDSLRASLDARVELLDGLLAAHVPAAGLLRPQAGAQAWIDVSACGLGAEPARLLLERGRLALQEGTDFGGGGEGFVRMSIGASVEVIEEAVRRISAVVDAVPATT